MARVSLSVALLCVCSMVTVPFLTVPLTLQSFALFVTLGLLGAREGGVAILVYLLLGAVGLPVFSGFTGGLGILFGHTGGFLFGFLLAVPVYALFTSLRRDSRLFSALGMAGGLLVSYLSGSLWYYFLFAKGTSYSAVLLLTVLPFLLPDAIKLSLALLISERMRKHLQGT